MQFCSVKPHFHVRGMSENAWHCPKTEEADLSEDKLTPAPPFSYYRVDFFGPWLITEGRKEVKRYRVLFTCMASRAIHLETANYLSTDAMRRFIAIRGPIRQLRSDRGTHFVVAERELIECFNKMDSDKIGQFRLKKGCDYFDFTFNVPRRVKNGWSMGTTYPHSAQRGCVSVGTLRVTSRKNSCRISNRDRNGFALEGICTLLTMSLWRMNIRRVTCGNLAEYRKRT